MEKSFETIVKVDQRNILLVKFSTYEKNNFVRLLIRNQVRGNYLATILTKHQLKETCKEILEALK
jgi:hypothetical protein